MIENKAVKIYKDYEEQEKLGKTPTFDPDKLGLKDVSDVWKNNVKEDEND